MSGKAYTMKEMKSIVDYLTEHKAYAEFKGRKMWMDFANSKLTTRTWQSLKETFLKRILPDIHNPYYKLTMDQIRCFKEGYDVIAKEKNKLEIFEIDDDSNSNAEKETETEKPSTSHDNNGKATSGEDIKCAKIQSHDRASVETVIIANCYETDEDLRRVLESESSPKSNNNEELKNATQSRSLRDLITYSEPLTPMLQEVLNDFASEDESDGELRMQIVENDVEPDPVNTNGEPVILIIDSDDVIEKNNTIEVIPKNNKITGSNFMPDKTVEDNLNGDKSIEDLKKDKTAEDNSKPTKATEDSISKDKSTEDNLKKRDATDSNLNKVKGTEEILNNDKSKERNIIKEDKAAKDILNKEQSAEVILDQNMATETIFVSKNSSEGNTEKNKDKKDTVETANENSEDKAKETSVENAEVIEMEDFVQPKVLSLKLRKRKAVSEKIQDKKPTIKNVKTRAEMYEIVEPEILEKSTTNVPEVDTLSNYANNKDEIVSSTVSDKPTQNSLNSDTILPNNQEALVNSGKLASTDDQMQNDISKSPNIPENVLKSKRPRKRAISQDVASTSKAKINKLNVDNKSKEKAISDTDDIRMKKLIKSKLTKSKLELGKKNVLEVVENETVKAETSKDIAKDTVLEDIPTSEPLIDSTQASKLNPCLKSVSLFAEQFNTVSYIDSESEHETTPAASASDKNKDNKPSTSKTEAIKKKVRDINKEKVAAAMIESKNKDKKTKKIKTTSMDDEVLMLKSHSDTESETKESSPKEKLPVSQDVTKAQRDKALANIFGFHSGGLKRKKRMSYRKNAAYYQRRDESSFESSDWTSDTDSESYVSPPRGRKNKQTRKYLKPQSARILSLEDEGGLFVMYGKKIYPLVKDGNIIKNYLTYLPESDPEEEESYWKLKYVEERKRVAELQKIMKENKEVIEREKSPILHAKPLRSLSTSHRQGSPFRSAPKKDSYKEEVIPEKEIKEVEKDVGQTLKITFAKNNQEVHMEGHWSHIHPVLAEVVQILNKDNDAPTNGAVKPIATKRPSDATSDQSVAIVPSPVDEGIPKIDLQEKVNKLETEIFKEIEVRDQEEDIKESTEQSEINVTKRKRASRVRKSTSTQRSSVSHSSPSSTGSLKRRKTSTDEPKDEVEGSKTPKASNKKDSKTNLKDVEPTKEAVNGADSTTSVAKVETRRTPKKNAKEVVNQSTKEINTRSTRRSKLPAEKTKENSSQVEDDPDIRYMLPPTTRSRKSTLNLNKSKDMSRRYMAIPPKILSAEHLSVPDESSQGYQDSDISLPKASLRRKRKLSLSTVLHRNQNKNKRVKRYSFPRITDDGSSDSNSSAFQIIVRRTSTSSLKSEAYRSESYQLLMPQNKNAGPLEKIDEDSPLLSDSSHPNKFSALDIHGRTIEISVNKVNNDFLTSSSNGNTDCGNSSNVSLPMSPELSIVENLSISQELVNSVENYPTINEMQAHKANTIIDNNYLISQVDVSMPLMQQDWKLHQSFSKKNKSECSYDPKKSLVSDSLLNKINIVNIADAPSLSESLDIRLRNLLLESAKKISITSVQEEVQDVKLVGKNEVQKKGKSNKRCSTPRKKKDLKKPKLPIADPVIEEEFVESCSYGGRNSCPPAIHVITADATHKEHLNEKDAFIEKGKGRRKKDVIKVKILRPKSKRLQSRSPEVTHNASKTTVHTDSGINESGLTVQGLNDSIDLIHNHSETCLLANECMGNSVEFVETNTKSIISLNTNSATSPDKTSREQFLFQDCHDFVPDLFCENAQSGHVDQVPESQKMFSCKTSDTIYHSPVISELSINSLITEDLSDETPQSSQPTKWYLLDEEDTSNANFTSRSTTNSTASSFGANLKQIFPITCAVPDLSTITEMSNDNSRKPTMDSANQTRHDLDSQSTFDMNSN